MEHRRGLHSVRKGVLLSSGFCAFCGDVPLMIRETRLLDARRVKTVENPFHAAHE